MRTTLKLIAIGATWLAAAALVTAQVPPVINFQGRITTPPPVVKPFDGSGLFKFALVNGVGDVTFWSNNDTSTGGNEPTASITLPVRNGIYSLFLGDGMSPIPMDLFQKHSEAYLRIWFLDAAAPAGTAFQLLSPDLRLATVPYAMMAAHVADKSVNGKDLADNIQLGSVGSGGIFSVLSGLTATDAGITADGASRELRLNQKNGTTGVAAMGDRLGNNSGGAIELYNGDGGRARVYVAGDSGKAGKVSVRDASGDDSITLNGADGALTTQGSLMVASGDSTRAKLYSWTGGGQLNLYNANATLIAALGAVSPSGSKLTLYDGGSMALKQADGDIGVDIDGDQGEAGYIAINNSAGGSSIRIDGAEGTDKGGEILFYNGSGKQTIQIDGDDPASGGWIGLYNPTANTDPDKVKIELDANATGGARITTQVLEITGGSDLSENFDVTATDALEPGMIVCVDRENPGQLVVSSKAYDSTVAGIISGAGGVQPGMLMGQRGTVADGKHPVALTGRVYAYADASNGPIEPGDLLTTAQLPGHAMKVADQARAQGAIIGKAMSSLRAGRGLVLVLVSLQ